MATLMKIREVQIREWDAQGVGQKIRDARDADDRSVQSLADAADISRGYWYELEKENLKGAVDIDVLRRIERVLGVALLED